MSEHDFLYREGIQELFKTTVKKFNINRLVYVGLPPANIFRHKNQMWWQDICKDMSIDYVILEVFRPWYTELIKEGLPALCYDVCEYVPDLNSLLLWSHGPEHVAKDEFEACLSRLVKLYTNIIVAMPYGVWEQTSSINPYEEHKWHADVNDLTDLGFDVVETNGPKDSFGDLYGVYYG